jgi:hypothetical protein
MRGRIEVAQGSAKKFVTPEVSKSATPVRPM